MALTQPKSLDFLPILAPKEAQVKCVTFLSRTRLIRRPSAGGFLIHEALQSFHLDLLGDVSRWDAVDVGPKGREGPSLCGQVCVRFGWDAWGRPWQRGARRALG